MKRLNLFAVLLALTAAAGGRKDRTPDKFVFAEGFTGGAVVIYGVASAPALPVVGGMQVLEFPADGVLQTSTAQQDGWAKDQYFRHQGSELKALREGAGSEEVFGGSSGSIGSCASVKNQYVGEPAKLEEMRKTMNAKLLGSVCKPK